MNYLTDASDQQAEHDQAVRAEARRDRLTDPARFRSLRTWLPSGMSQVPYSEGD